MKNETIYKCDAETVEQPIVAAPAEAGAECGGGATPPSTRKSGLSQKKKQRLAFYSLFISIPVIHFLIFYVYINFNSIIMSFQVYDPETYTASFAGFDNFVFAWKEFASPEKLYRIGNSLLFFGVDTFICLPLALLFSYYLYKQYFFSAFFKVILFLPQLLSMLVLGLIYKYISSDVYCYFANLGWWTDITIAEGQAAGTGLLMSTVDVAHRYIAVIFFYIMMCFGVNVLTYTSTMGGISDSLIESAQLDGANSLQEFFFIVLPMAYPTISTLFVVNLAHLFTNQAHLFTLYSAGGGELSTVGYFLYFEAQDDANLLWDNGAQNYTYPQLSAYGLITTAIILPLTMTVRHFMNKYGPSAE